MSFWGYSRRKAMLYKKRDRFLDETVHDDYNFSMAESIEGRKAFIIGGSGGIGAAVSRALAVEKVVLTVHGGHDGEKLSALVKELSSSTDAKGMICPLERELELLRQGCAGDEVFWKEVRNADILCICCGPFLQKPLDETSGSEWSLAAGMNLELPGVIVSEALRGMKERKWGRILLFGGTGSSVFRGYRTNAAYGAAKTGLCNLAKSVAVEYAGYGITCNVILPGFTDTEFVPEPVKKTQREKMPLGKLVQTSEIGETAAFLLKMGCINGALVNVDYGWMP